MVMQLFENFRKVDFFWHSGVLEPGSGHESYMYIHILGGKSSAHLGVRVNSVLTRTGCI